MHSKFGPHGFAGMSIVLCVLATALAEQSLDRGHRVLLFRGLQIQALLVPRGWHDSTFTPATWKDTNFTTVNTGFYPNDFWEGQWGQWAMGNEGEEGGEGYKLRKAEQRYVNNLVTYCWNDEKDLEDPEILQYLKAFIEEVHARYPNVIAYHSAGEYFTHAVWRNYMTMCQPDMLMFADYPFTGAQPSIAYSEYYNRLSYFRDLALGGIDGTGKKPIPFAVHTQAIAQFTHHMPSESEIRLNYFSAWAFGCKLVCAFTYTDPSTNHDFTMLFDGSTDQVRSPWFDLQAEVNRQSLNLGPTLIRLLTSDLRWLPGRSQMDGEVRRHPVPRGIEQWNAEADPYITKITRTSTWTATQGLEGDLIIGYFRPLLESFDGDRYEDEIYFMIVNGLTAHNGPAHVARQLVYLDFDFGDQRINSLQRLSRDTGEVEIIPLVHDDGSKYHVNFVLEGGDGDLFKFNTGAPFVGAYTESSGGDQGKR